MKLHLATLALTTASIAATANAQTVQVNKENRTIAITATDSVTVMADTATVHIGFIAYGPDKDSAYTAGSNLSNAIVKALTSAGVSNDAIESENQNVAPVQDYQVNNLTPTEKAQRKFQVTQSWTVRTIADNASKVLDVAVKAGANQSGQIDWSLKDENASQAEAAAKALQRARTVAAQMAAGMNVKLGNLLYAGNEAQTQPPVPIMRAMEVNGGVLPADKVAPLAINPRRIEKTATVAAVFAIE